VPPVGDNELLPDQQSIPLPPNVCTIILDNVDTSTPDLGISYPATGRSIPPVIGSSATPIRPPSLTFVGAREGLWNVSTLNYVDAYP
jgi:hypothetical protein